MLRGKKSQVSHLTGEFFFVCLYVPLYCHVIFLKIKGPSSSKKARIFLVPDFCGFWIYLRSLQIGKNWLLRTLEFRFSYSLNYQFLKKSINICQGLLNLDLTFFLYSFKEKKETGLGRKRWDKLFPWLSVKFFVKDYIPFQKEERMSLS